MGFGGLLTFTCRELRYELCGWLISQYDFTYHKLKMATGSAVNVNEQHVSQVMDIPNTGEDLVIVKRTGPSNLTYTLRVLEQNLDNLPVVTVGAEADDDGIKLLLSEVKGKDIIELIASGREKLTSVPSGGSVAVAAVAASGGDGGGVAPAATEPKKEEKVEEKEESDEDMGFSLFD
ncbi:60S acidic ribosomal protein P2A-like [Vitis riparia]|uniref:60S acidic ribosomal protein P2A-like n=1 Tax=Vitis riparia TaxID=96939 RepID=UPI00155A1B11|nr:60S acidic ribosomal protein P2A-like [Vitis riparia]